LRLDDEMRRRVARIARKKKTTPSRVIREAIATLIEREERPGSVYDAIKDLIGNVRGGDPTLSTDTGRKFTELLRARRKPS
jgi:predicted DNA-binding protein